MRQKNVSVWFNRLLFHCQSFPFRSYSDSVHFIPLRFVCKVPFCTEVLLTKLLQFSYGKQATAKNYNSFVSHGLMQYTEKAIL